MGDDGDKFLFFGWVIFLIPFYVLLVGHFGWMIFMAFKKSNNEIKTNIYLRDTQVLSLDIFYSLADKVLLFYCKLTDYKNKYEGLYV